MHLKNSMTSSQCTYTPPTKILCKAMYSGILSAKRTYAVQKREFVPDQRPTSGSSRSDRNTLHSEGRRTAVRSGIVAETSVFERLVVNATHFNA